MPPLAGIIVSPRHSERRRVEGQEQSTPRRVRKQRRPGSSGRTQQAFAPLPPRPNSLPRTCKRELDGSCGSEVNKGSRDEPPTMGPAGEIIGCHLQENGYRSWGKSAYGIQLSRSIKDAKGSMTKSCRAWVWPRSCAMTAPSSFESSAESAPALSTIRERMPGTQ